MSFTATSRPLSSPVRYTASLPGSRAASRPWRTASAHRHDELRPRARARIQDAGEGSTSWRTCDRAPSPVLAPPARRVPRPIDVPNTATELASNGARSSSNSTAQWIRCPSASGRAVITEDDTSNLGARSHCGRSGSACRKAPWSHFLFLGLRPNWNLRLILNRIWRPPGRHRSGRPARAERTRAGVLAAADVTAVDVDPESYVELLRGGWSS
jgi:hypothetical protein